MTSLETCIREAVEKGGFPGGFHPKTGNPVLFDEDGEDYVIGKEEVLLMPEFWSALGRARGWEDEPSICKGCQTLGIGTGNHMMACPIKHRTGGVMKNWHRFIDKLASGGTVEEFFSTLV